MRTRITLAALLVLVVSLTGCTESTLAPQDTTAPAAPQSIALTTSNGALALSWQPSGDADVIGYYVYRTPTGAEQGTAVQLNGDAVVASTYTLPMDAGQWLYQVRAADSAGNLSAPSAAITVTMANGSQLTPDPEETVKTGRP